MSNFRFKVPILIQLILILKSSRQNWKHLTTSPTSVLCFCGGISSKGFSRSCVVRGAAAGMRYCSSLSQGELPPHPVCIPYAFLICLTQPHCVCRHNNWHILPDTTKSNTPAHFLFRFIFLLGMNRHTRSRIGEISCVPPVMFQGRFPVEKS